MIKIFMKFYTTVGYNAGSSRLDFGGNPVLDSDPGISWKNSATVGSATVPKLQPLADLKLNNLKAAAVYPSDCI